MSSWRSNTSKKYNSYIEQWIEFYEKSSRNIQNATIKDGLDFLTNLFKYKKNDWAISCARSILSLFVILEIMLNLVNSRLYKNIWKEYFTGDQVYPSIHSSLHSWDVRKLLDYYRSQSNNNELDLKVLTFKTTILLTILLCQRAQTAYSLDLKCVKVEEDKIQIAFPSLLK